MRLFDVGHEARGFIAFGQFATGFIAVGQVATGVIAIGQVARGVVAIGQVGFGLVLAGGMGSASLGGSFGMAGVGGRNLFGLIIPLVPSVGKPRVVPATVAFSAAQAAGEGWVDVEVVAGEGGQPALRETSSGAILPVKIDHRAAGGAAALIGRADRVLARLERASLPSATVPGPLVCARLLFVPPPPFKKKGYWILAALQLAAYLVLAVVWWIVVGQPVLEGLARL